MLLKSGQDAIPFTAQAASGETVSLAQFAGKPLLVMFFRYASCPMCNLRLHDFAREYGRLRERGLMAVAFFHSSAPSIRAHAGVRPLPFPLLADPEFRVYNRYSVQTSWGRLLRSLVKPTFYVDWLRSWRHRFWGGVAWRMATMPADFLIGPDGRIVVAHYGRDIGDHLPLARIEACLDELGLPAAARSPLPSRADPRPPSDAPAGSLPVLIGLALLWGLALVSSSFFLKGLAIGGWVDSVLYLVAVGWLGKQLMQGRIPHCA